MDDPDTATQAAPRRRSSRAIDSVSDVLGHELTFGAIVVFDIAMLGVIAVVGTHDYALLSAIALGVSLLTLIMVCAVQHTSSRESKALNLKLDELIRVSPGRNDLIGAEDESHRQLHDRAARLREHHRAGDAG